ncbi:HD domain-containing protein [Patescibacteria group bacterium]|nr:HD domain-containing protein [Patescibacteria group bacterium]
MEAKDGIGFLAVLISQGYMTYADLKEAIRIAEKNSPSSAFDRAARHYGIHYGIVSEQRAFAKGVRWLAMIRRDESPAAFYEAITRLLAIQLVSNASQGIKDQVEQAVEFALKRHTGQMRPGGEPQAIHLLRVGIAAVLYARRQHLPEKEFLILVQSDILHDVLEDTETKDEELIKLFGKEVTQIVRALSHIEEEEPDEVYLARVAEGGKLAVLAKRFDRLDNICSLVKMPIEFRNHKIEEIKKALAIWRKIDPEGSREIENALKEVAK